MAARALKARRSGHKQGRTKGDALQQGGEGLFDSDGTLLWSYTSKEPGDHATEAQIRAAVQAAIQN